MKTQLKKLLTVLCGTFVVGCGSGTNSEAGSSSQQVAPPVGEVDESTNALAVAGPIRYNKIDHHHRNYPISRATQSSKALNATTQTFTFNNAQCAPLMSDGSNDGAALSGSVLATLNGTADGLMNFLGPEVGAAFSLGTGLLTDFLGGPPPDTIAADTMGCISALETQIASQVNYMDSQITQLQQSVLTQQNEFYKQNVAVAQQFTGLYEQSLSDANIYIDGGGSNGQFVSNGVYQELMDAAGLTNNGVPVAGANLLTMASQVFPRLSVGTFSIAYAIGFQNAVQNISGSSLNVGCRSNCFTQVNVNSNSALIQTYKSLNKTFMTQLPVALASKANGDGTSNPTVAPLFDQYNDTIVAIYLSQLKALQQSYTIEWMINRMNFYAYTTSSMPNLMIPSLGQVAGTYYNYNTVMSESSTATPQTQVAAYNDAQNQLAKLYAARINVLFNNTISYMISDKPSVMQHPLVESGAIFYVNLPASKTQFTQQTTSASEAAQINQSFVQTLGSKVQSALSLLPGNSYKNQAVFYQYKGLIDQSRCESATQSYTLNSGLYNNTIGQAINSQSCPMMYSDINGQPVNNGEWNNNTLQPYFINSNNQLTRASNVSSNLYACQIGQTLGDLTGDLYFWQPSAANSPTGQATQYLMCNYWKNDRTTALAYNIPSFSPPSTTPGGGVFRSVDYRQTAANYALDLNCQNASPTFWWDTAINCSYADWSAWALITNNDIYSNASFGATPISTSNNNIFFLNYDNPAPISFGTQMWMGWTGATLPDNPGGTLTFGGLANAGITDTEEYINLQSTLPDSDHLIVPYTVAVMNMEGGVGNFGAVACAYGVETVNLEAANGQRVQLCSMSYPAQYASQYEWGPNYNLVPGSVSYFRTYYVATFLNNPNHNLYMSSHGSYGNSGKWNIWHGPLDDNRMAGYAW